MRTSFRNKLLLLIVALLGLTLLSAMLAVLRATDATVEALVSEELAVAERVFLTLLERDSGQLQDRGALLAGDFAFKRAIATQDRNTIVTVLANHAERIGADLVLLLSSDQEVLLSSHQSARIPEAIAQRLNEEAREVIEFATIVDGEPYQLVLVPVLAPDLIGWIGLGITIDTQMLGRLQRLTAADITLVYGDGATVAWRSTLAPDVLSSLAGAGDVTSATAEAGQILQDGNWLNRRVALVEGSGDQVTALLSASLDHALANYEPLRLQMVLIGLAALLLAALTTALVARWVTRPIYRLVAAARQIADGNYTRAITLEDNTEFDELAKALNFMQDTVSEREARIRHQAQHDMLTQLPNRNYLYTLFNRHLSENLGDAHFGMGLMDISNLNHITDLYGSDFSDRVLQLVAERVTLSLRRGDMAARIADRQLLLFFDALSHAGVARVTGKLQADFVEPLEVQGIPVRIEITLGFVLCPQHGTEFDDVLRRAQIALSRALAAKRGYALYEIGQDETHLRQIRVANRLQVAVRERAFTLYYQPKYNLRTQCVDQVEALMRWTDDELGNVYPDEFIPLAEQTGIITQISSIVIDSVLAQLRQWRSVGLQVSACVNLSGLDILQKPFIDELIERLENSGLPPEAVVLEITETAMVTDMEAANRNIAELVKTGVQLAIDDFGTGFSSLAQLKSLPVQELKIDKSLVLNLADDGDDQLIVRSTIEMAHYLGLKVVAEGVENEASLKLLSEMGCDSVQGYYFARPMTNEDLLVWMRHPPEHMQRITEVIDAVA